jgi:hypothetical protein
VNVWHASGLVRSAPSLIVVSGAGSGAGGDSSDSLVVQVKALGDEIRAMKAAKAGKEDVMAKVAALNALKADLEVETYPAAAASTAAAPSVTPIAAPKAGAKFKHPPPGFSAPQAAPGGPIPGLETSAPRLKVRAIQESLPAAVVGQEVWVKGWVRTIRAAGAELAFLELNDGSSRAGLQVNTPRKNRPPKKRSRRCLRKLS